MLVDDTQDLYVAELPFAPHSVKKHDRIESGKPVMVEVGMRGQPYVCRHEREILLVPDPPYTGRVVPPRIDDDGDTLRRGQLERHMAVVFDFQLPVRWMQTAILLNLKSAIVVRLLRPGTESVGRAVGVGNDIVFEPLGLARDGHNGHDGCEREREHERCVVTSRSRLHG